MNSHRSIAISSSPAAILGFRDLSDWIATLAPYERKNAESFKKNEGRVSYVAAHILIRQAAALLVNRSPQSLVLAQHCDVCGNHYHGRPSFVGLSNVYVSLSHTMGAVAAAASDAPVGIDVENLKSIQYSVMRSQKVFSLAEITELDELNGQEQNEAALKLWVQKECLVKLGITSLDALSTCDLNRLPAGMKISRWTNKGNTVVGAVAGTLEGELIILD